MGFCPLLFVMIAIIFHGTSSQMVGTKPPPTTSSCPSISEITSAMQKLFDAQTNILMSKLADMEARLDDITACSSMAPGELFMGIYEDLSISNDWLLIYNKPYNYSTTTKELYEVANKCNSNRIVVGAINTENFNKITVAAVGPTRVLYLNNTVEAPEEIENVLWYLESGRAFGFRPIENDPDIPARSELFLGWHVDLNYGGWRAGKLTNLYQSSLWRKVIYCMPTFQKK